MNKNRWIAVSALSILIIIFASTINWSRGWCIVYGNDPVMLVRDDGNILILTNSSPVSNRLHKYKTGDRILVFHNGVMEMSPGRTSAYFCMRLARGTTDDIPDDLLHTLQLHGISP